MSAVRGDLERCPEVSLAEYLGVSAVCDEPLYHDGLSLAGCRVQRRTAPTHGGIYVGTSSQQSLDLSQISLSGCLVQRGWLRGRFPLASDDQENSD
jgi:hypothetical protein